MRTCWPILIVAAALPLISQQEPVFRVSSDLVEVDAVVTDPQGHHVADLKLEDFRILEDGKPQTITHFTYVQGSVAPGSPGPVNPTPNQSGGASAEENPLPARALPRDQVRRTIVMIADDLGLSSDDIPNVRKTMKNFADLEMQPGDLVSVMTTSGGMGVMAQLTNDKRRLYASIDSIHWSPARTGLTWYEPVRKIDVAVRSKMRATDG